MLSNFNESCPISNLIKNPFSCVRFEVSTPVTTENAVFWDVALCRSYENRRFGGTLVHTRSTQRHIPEDGILHHFSCSRVLSRGQTDMAHLFESAKHEYIQTYTETYSNLVHDVVSTSYLRRNPKPYLALQSSDFQTYYNSAFPA
jgi:hypothetical protein